MKELVRRFTESLVRPVCPVPAASHPSPCVRAAGLTARPCLTERERRIAEAWRGRRAMWLAAHGVDIGPSPYACATEAAA